MQASGFTPDNMPSSEAHSRFLALSTEIRLNVYHHLFADNQVRVYLHQGHRITRGRERAIAFQIALTCHLCCDEALPVYYSTLWTINESVTPRSFCMQADPDLLERVKQIYLHNLSDVKEGL